MDALRRGDHRVSNGVDTRVDDGRAARRSGHRCDVVVSSKQLAARQPATQH